MPTENSVNFADNLSVCQNSPFLMSDKRLGTMTGMADSSE